MCIYGAGPISFHKKNNTTMKHLTTLAALLLMLVACAEKEELVTVRFDLGGVQTGTITKASSSAVGDAIAATATTEPPTLTLQSTTVAARTYTVLAGQEAQVAIDRYTVTANHRPSSLGNCLIGEVYATPAYTINEAVTVDGSRDSFTLTAIYSCFALVIDHDVTAQYAVLRDDVFNAFAQYDREAGVEVRYVVPNNSVFMTGNTTLRATPVDNAGHEATEWRVRWAGVATVDCELQNGYWYCFTPNAVTLESGTFSVRLPNFREGWND